jgi:glycosyltransferase involved in cell wall biosynthesis
MHVLIDVQALQSPNTRGRGIDRYVRNLLAALAEARPDWRVTLVQSARWEPLDARHLPDYPLVTFRPPLPAGSDPADANAAFYADWLTAQGPDHVLLTSCFDENVVVPRFIGPRPPVASVLYDLIPLLFHDHFLADPAARAAYGDRFRRLLAADQVFSISKASADDLRALAGEECPSVTVIGGAPDPAFGPLPPASLERLREVFGRRFGMGREFVLYVGGFDYRKNLRGALEAFAALPDRRRRELDLVLACRLVESHRRTVREWAGELGLAESLKLTGYVSDEALRALYGLCRLFFFPSLYEGLGLPVLEALSCGAPVVASDRSAVPEAAGPGSWLFDPRSPAEAAAALTAALAEPRDARRRERLAHAGGFRWDVVAERAARALERPPAGAPPVASTGGRRLLPDRPRLAWVSPLPPALTGIADYSAELLEALSARYDIELVAGSGATSVSPALARRHVAVPAEEAVARHAARPYDLFVYHVGNSHHHVYLLDLLRRYRGLVVLHDFYLGGLVQPAVHCGAWPVSLADELEHDGALRQAAALRAGRTTPDAVVDQVPLNRRVLSWAGGVIVHSRWTWRRVRRLVDVPVAHVPHAASPPELRSRAEERRRLRLGADDFVVATLGFVGPPKRIGSLLRAVARLPGGLRHRTQVLVVGYAPPAEEKALRARADELGLTPHVQFRGRVALDDFAAYARAADVCVQLRYPTRGETSGALLRELAAGAACVVSDHGSIAELPEGVAVKVRTPDQEVPDLAAALTRLARQPAERTRLGEAARRYVRERHGFALVAERFAALIELAAAGRRQADVAWVEQACDALAACRPAAADELAERWAAARAGAREAGARRTDVRRRERGALDAIVSLVKG